MCFADNSGLLAKESAYAMGSSVDLDWLCLLAEVNNTGLGNLGLARDTILHRVLDGYSVHRGSGDDLPGGIAGRGEAITQRAQ